VDIPNLMSIFPIHLISGILAILMFSKSQLVFLFQADIDFVQLRASSCHYSTSWLDNIGTSAGRKDTRHVVRPGTFVLRFGLTGFVCRIFEPGGEEDCLRLIVGPTPSSTTTITSQHTNPSSTVPLSSHYAKALARLSADLGFDGWLLNFECPLKGGLVQTHLLSAWITILRRELQLLVGSHAQVVW
jgi:mannosyl-glycoprotein endo-beta-N-acetylglucosaminidase